MQSPHYEFQVQLEVQVLLHQRVHHIHLERAQHFPLAHHIHLELVQQVQHAQPLQLVQLQGSALLDTATDTWGSRQLQEALPSMGDAQQARVCDELAPQLLLQRRSEPQPPAEVRRCSGLGSGRRPVRAR